MSHTWQDVARHGLDVLQVLGLAYIAKRGIVLPPVNRRAPERSYRKRSGAAKDDAGATD